MITTKPSTEKSIGNAVLTKINQFLGNSDSTEGKGLAWHEANLGLIPEILYGSLSIERG